MVSVRATEYVLELTCVEHLQHHVLIEGALDVAARQDVGEVEQRAGHARAGMPSTSSTSRGSSVVLVRASMPLRPRPA